MTGARVIPFKCRLCGADQQGPVIAAREMMYGTREPFDYVACNACGCVQILSVPDDLGKYYPTQYYSMDAPHETLGRALLKVRRARYLRGERTLIGLLVDRLKAAPPRPSWLDTAGVSFSDPILDVGCGGGHLLLQLRDLGFTNLTGVDPFVSSDLRYAGGVRIFKRQLSEMDGRFAFVMLHHSLEHMPDQVATLKEVRRLIAGGGRALIRIPVLGFAWREYGADWLALDPPRHLYAHSVKSFTLAAEQAGFRIGRVLYDSSGMQFWASEQFRRGISLFAPDSVASGARHLFSESQLAEWERRSVELNAAQDGDQAAFFLDLA